jgi:hypothetical protein
MEGKYQLDFYCTTPEAQHHVEEALGYLLHQIGGFGRSPQPGATRATPQDTERNRRI